MQCCVASSINAISVGAVSHTYSNCEKLSIINDIHICSNYWSRITTRCCVKHIVYYGYCYASDRPFWTTNCGRTGIFINTNSFVHVCNMPWLIFKVNYCKYKPFQYKNNDTRFLFQRLIDQNLKTNPPPNVHISGQDQGPGPRSLYLSPKRMTKQELWKKTQTSAKATWWKSSQFQQLPISRTEAHIQVTYSMIVTLNSVAPPADENVMSAEWNVNALSSSSLVQIRIQTQKTSKTYWYLPYPKYM